MVAVTITQITPPELEALINKAVNKAIESYKPGQTPSLADFVTRGQACKLLDITYPTLHAWIKKGKLTLHHVGGRSYLKESEVLALIKPVQYTIETA